MFGKTQTFIASISLQIVIAEAYSRKSQTLRDVICNLLNGGTGPGLIHGA
jgi:hypothetical protein